LSRPTTRSATSKLIRREVCALISRVTRRRLIGEGRVPK
jgi:hypothetical protein